mmetsp:Transcript_27236/g.63474  ORF Transcript_27236/g.63474 Transcript_27236/m.63474 type:complete len:241 (+) Transcript_27236:177-899(+)
MASTLRAQRLSTIACLQQCRGQICVRSWVFLVPTASDCSARASLGDLVRRLLLLSRRRLQEGHCALLRLLLRRHRHCLLNRRPPLLSWSRGLLSKCRVDHIILPALVAIPHVCVLIFTTASFLTMLTFLPQDYLVAPSTLAREQRLEVALPYILERYIHRSSKLHHRFLSIEYTVQVSLQLKRILDVDRVPITLVLQVWELATVDSLLSTETNGDNLFVPLKIVQVEHEELLQQLCSRAV